MLQCLVESMFPPSPGFLLKVATTTFHLVGFTDRHPASWVVAAASRTFPVPLHSSKVYKAAPDSREMCEACSACMEKLTLPQGREGT